MDAITVLLALNQELQQAMRAVLADLCDKQLAFVAPALDRRTFAEVLIHAYRPVLAATSVVAGRAWPPPLPPVTTVVDLSRVIDGMVAEVSTVLAGVDPATLARPVALRWGTFESGTAAIGNALAHGFVHVGVLRGTRALGGVPTPAEE